MRLRRWPLSIGSPGRAAATFQELKDQKTMPGRLETWPAWPEYTAEAGEQGEDLVEYKKSIVEQYGKENIINSWLKVCKELETITLNIADQGTAAIPELRYEDVFHLDVDGKQKLKDVGCFVVRDVYPRSQADQWFQDLKSYVAANKDQVKGESIFQPQPHRRKTII